MIHIRDADGPNASSTLNGLLFASGYLLRLLHKGYLVRLKKTQMVDEKNVVMQQQAELKLIQDDDFVIYCMKDSQLL